MQYGLNCSTLRKVIYEQIEKKEGEKKRKRGLHQNEVNLLCLALGFGWLCEKKWNWVSLISTEVQLFRFALPAQQRWFCSCETKWDFYAKDIEDICNCIYSEPSPLCDFYLASCDISPYGRSTGGKWLTIRLNWLWIHFIQTTSSDGSFCLSHLKEKDRACGFS